MHCKKNYMSRDGDFAPHTFDVYKEMTVWSIMQNSGRTETLYRYKTVSSVSHGYLYTYTYNSTNQPQLCLTLLRWLPHPSRWKTDEYGWFLAWDAYLAKVLTQCSTCLGWLPPVGSLDVLPWSSYHQPPTSPVASSSPIILDVSLFCKRETWLSTIASVAKPCCAFRKALLFCTSCNKVLMTIRWLSM